MKIERAEQILNSKGVTDVTYHNESVWIENVNKLDNTVYVKNLDTRKEYTVPASDLVES